MLARMPRIHTKRCSIPLAEFVFGPDLGTDHVWSWKLDTGPARWCQTRASMPPRSLRVRARATCPSIRAATSRTPIGEMVSSITAYRYDAEHGTLHLDADGVHAAA